MTANARALLFSHVSIFIAGFSTCWLLNRDELLTYRAAHESTANKFRRIVANVAIGALAIGSVIVAARMGGRKGDRALA